MAHTTGTPRTAALRRFAAGAAASALCAGILVAAPGVAGAQVGPDVAPFGDAASLGSPGGGARQAAMTATSTGGGYWIVDRAGEIEEFGDAAELGDLTEIDLVAPIVGMESSADDAGLWLAARDGGVFTLGSAQFHGSAGGIRLNQPIVGLAVTPTGGGYWLAASDGGVFAYGDAAFHGSMGGVPLAEPVVGIEATPTGDGYWLVASDGGIFAFGDAPFNGSAGDIALNQSITGMASARADGYWLVGGDGGVFTYGTADFLGSLAGTETSPIVGIEPTPSGRGYWLLPTGTLLGEDCEGNGYRVSFPTGWHTNDGAVVDPCRYFDASPITVPPESELLTPAVAMDVSTESASAIVSSIRSGGDVVSERGGVIDGRGSFIIEWIAGDGGLVPAGTRSYAHIVPFPDGRSLTIVTRSVANGSFDFNRQVVSEMAATVDIIALNVTTDPDTNEGNVPAGTVMHLVDARAGSAPGFDRFVLEFREDFEPTWDARYVSGPPTRPGSGQQVDVDGDAVLQIDVRPARTHDLDAPGQPASYTGPDVVDSSALESMTEAVFLGDFEGVMSWAIGVDERVGFRVFSLSDPARVVIDVNH